ncbi:MAG TPA: hypothetical protein VFJ58_11920 [Armatimonadota bacterium]|nr:hypothetical protein [Armatimonadota bacterium]
MFVALCAHCKKQFFSAARENLRACVDCHQSMEVEVADLSPRHPLGTPHLRLREDLRLAPPRSFPRAPSPIVDPVDVWPNDRDIIPPGRIYRRQ